MRFITVRDFRSRSAQVWKQLFKEKEIVVTSNGKPIAVLSSCPDGRLEESLNLIRRAKALSAAENLQLAGSAQGRASAITPDDINREIREVRKKRRS